MNSPPKHKVSQEHEVIFAIPSILICENLRETKTLSDPVGADRSFYQILIDGFNVRARDLSLREYSDPAMNDRLVYKASQIGAFSLTHTLHETSRLGAFMASHTILSRRDRDSTYTKIFL
ncbi:MAG: hypothetical protein ACQETF_00015 [Bacteroidota bacterium]